MAPHSSTLAWKIPWTEESGRLPSMGSLRVRYNWVTSLSLFTFMHWRRKWQPTPVFLPGGSQGRGSLLGWGAVYGVAQSRTRLKWLNNNNNTKHKTLSKVSKWKRKTLNLSLSPKLMKGETQWFPSGDTQCCSEASGRTGGHSRHWSSAWGSEMQFHTPQCPGWPHTEPDQTQMSTELSERPCSTGGD